jgi:predicted TIM-barrel fold metal-dependent hydrolase
MAEAIDANHHLWSYQHWDFSWISPGMGLLVRDFLPEHLRVEPQKTQVVGTPNLASSRG